MKKIFLLIPVLALSLLVNAKEIHITPTSPHSSGNNLLATLSDAGTVDGDVIILADGTYNEYSNYIDFNKSVEVKAADGAKPVVNVGCYIKVQGGKTVSIKGIKFDGTEQGHNGNTYNYFIRVYDAGANRLELDNCEFCNIDDRVILVEADKHLDLLKINNCYFHDVTNSAIHIVQASGSHACDKVEIANSTFANFSGFGDKGLIEVFSNGGAIAADPADDQELNIDHCTFYNIIKNADNTYGIIDSRKTTKVEVSNCIFVNPASLPAGSYSPKATQLYGGTVSNCMLLNVPNHRTDAITLNSPYKDVDPLFVDAANADYTLHMASPARGAATDASDLGDPRWAKEIRFSSDFSTDLVLPGIDAVLKNDIKLTPEYYLQSTNQDEATHAAEYGTATWLIHAEKACYIQVTVDVSSGNTSGHNYSVEIFDKTNASLGTVAQSGASWNGDDKTLVGMIALPAVDDYKIVLSNNQEWSSTIIENITISYAGGDVVNIPGLLNINDAIHNGTRADGVISFADATTGYAQWNIAVTDEAFYDISISIKNQWEHNLTATIYEADGVTPVGSATKGNLSSADNTSGHSFSMGGVYLATGNYVLKVTNARDGSDAKIMGLNITPAGGAIQPVPGTAANSEAWFSNNGTRVDGKISFSTYTDAWVKWNVKSTSGGTYNVKLYIENTVDLGHAFVVNIYETTEGTPFYSETWNSSHDATNPIEIDCGSFTFTAGVKYTIKVTNSEKDSQAKVINVVTSYVSGGTVNIPNPDIPFSDADLGGGYAYIDGSGHIHFVDDDHTWLMHNGYAIWNIHAPAGLYTFTAHCCSPDDYSNLKIRILDGENNEVYTYTPQYTYKQDDKAITSPQWLLDGDYKLELSNPATHSHGYLLSLSADAVENVIVIDPTVDITDLLEAANDNARIATIKRSFKGDMFNTICVPFNVSSNSELEGIFGVGYELLEMTSAILDGDILNLNFAVPANNIEYGRPYLIKPTQDVVNPVFNSHNIHKSTSYLTVECAAANFIGKFCPGVIPASEYNLFLTTNNRLVFPTTEKPITGTHAYFKVKVPGGANVISRARIVQNGQEVTAVDLVNEENNNSRKIIENGQLIIIRDGVRYNVMGIVIEK